MVVTIVLAEEEILALSQARREAVKDFLVKEGGIDPERLILCSPGVDKDEKAKPRVDFSL
jgi:outer membrane protein OmpA-like peptidoglycan-associated protein